MKDFFNKNRYVCYGLLMFLLDLSNLQYYCQISLCSGTLSAFLWTTHQFIIAVWGTGPKALHKAGR